MVNGKIMVHFNRSKFLRVLLGQDNETKLPWDTPPKTNMEAKNWWFVDVSPFPRGHFQVPC